MPPPLYNLIETSPPAIEPVALADVKEFLRITPEETDEDTLLTIMIIAARQLCEQLTGRSLITRPYSLFLDAWDGTPLQLPRPPLAGVTQVNVYAADNSATVFSSANYFVDTAGARLVLKEGGLAPLPGRVVSGIEVQYTAGYGATAVSVPAALRQAMLQLIVHLYDNRADTTEQSLAASGARPVFQAYRVMAVA